MNGSSPVVPAPERPFPDDVEAPPQAPVPLLAGFDEEESLEPHICRGID